LIDVNEDKHIRPQTTLGSLEQLKTTF